MLPNALGNMVLNMLTTTPSHPFSKSKVKGNGSLIVTPRFAEPFLWLPVSLQLRRVWWIPPHTLYTIRSQNQCTFKESSGRLGRCRGT